MSYPKTIKFEYGVSEGDTTLQYFDFIAQVISKIVEYDEVDRMLLCELVKQLASSKQFGSPISALGLQGPKL